MSTIIICAILVVICFFGIRSSMKRVSNGCCGTGDDVKKVKSKRIPMSLIIHIILKWKWRV